ncbi:hypothetical protein [Streptomyces sp. NBC_01497]|uniref:hypothetical protein n=1 Tax=Streptomyces sp. NBC_01497 TaxID=2903885 RepID=UPI002E30782C|nr:hypothetical protein [Streptomyces sp. NBC_01497]
MRRPAPARSAGPLRGRRVIGQDEGRLGGAGWCAVSATRTKRGVSLIEPTAEGAGAADRYARTLIGWFTEAVAHWSDRDRDDLGRLLTRFADDVTAHLGHLDDVSPPTA